MTLSRYVSGILVKIGDLCRRLANPHSMAPSVITNFEPEQAIIPEQPMEPGMCEVRLSPLEQTLEQWRKDKGDKTLRLEYDLGPNSVVFDLGGYEGQWASDLFARYCCIIHIFEPVPEFAARIEKRFERNKSIVIHRFGLSDETKVVKIYLGDDASSMYGQTGDQCEAHLMKAADFIDQSNIHKIDLLKINIEGGEYDLLEHLIESGVIENITDIQVQFHDIIPNAEQRMRTIKDRLRRTHIVTYEYEFVWENWRKRKR